MTSYSVPFSSSGGAEAVTRGRCWTDPGLDSALDAVSFTGTAAEALAVAEAHCVRVEDDPERLGLAVPELARACATQADRAKSLALCEELVDQPTLVSRHALALFAQMCRDWAWESRTRGGEPAEEFDRPIGLALQLGRHAALEQDHVAGWAVALGALTDTQGHDVETNLWAQHAHERWGFVTPVVEQYARTLEPRRGGNVEKQCAYGVTVAQAHPYSYVATVLPRAVLGLATGALEVDKGRFPSLFRMGKAAVRLVQLGKQHQSLFELCSDAALARAQSVGDELLSHRTHQWWAHFYGTVGSGNDSRRLAHAAHMGNRFHAISDGLGMSFDEFVKLRSAATAD